MGAGGTFVAGVGAVSASSPTKSATTWPIAGNYLFVFSAWQLLFFNGLALGYQRDRMPALTQRGARRLQIGTGIAFLGLIAGFVLLEAPAAALPAQLSGLAGAFTQAQLWIQEFVFGKADLRIGRVVAAAVVIPFMFLTLTRQWRVVSRPLAWLLIPLGEKSLNAFTAHVVLVAVVALALTPFGLAASSPWWLNAMIQIGSVMLIWVIVRRHVFEPTPKTQPIWRASPIAVALVAVVLLPWLPAPRTLASTTMVSDEVMARARAYGTPVVSLDRAAAAPVSEAVLARARAYGTPVVSLTRSAAAPAQAVAGAQQAVGHATNTPVQASSVGPAARPQVVSVATPVPQQPAETPRPVTTPLPTTAPAPAVSSAGSAKAAATPAVATPQPAIDVAPQASLLQRIATNLIPAAPAAQKPGAQTAAVQAQPSRLPSPYRPNRCRLCRRIASICSPNTSARWLARSMVVRSTAIC